MSDDRYTDALAKLLGYEAPPTDKTHYEALGRFIATFANTEGMVHVLTRKFSGLTDEKARIAFGGMRLSDMTDRLRQYLGLDNIANETFSEIDYCLTQLSSIAERRHKLVHRGASYSFGALVSSNVMTTRSTKHVEVEKIDQKLLEDMTLDCGAIFLRLMDVAYPERSDEKTKKTLAIARGIAWRYKHEPPKPVARRKALGSAGSAKRTVTPMDGSVLSASGT